MRALFIFSIICSSLFKVSGQSKEIMHEYYSFKSSCFFTLTENESGILTLYKDKSFLFEVFLNKYSSQVYYTRSSYSGVWTVDNEVIVLKYFNHGVESLTEKIFETLVTQNKFVLSAMPVRCRIESENLITDSKLLPTMNTAKNKMMALAEKWGFDNFMTTKNTKKIKFSTLSIEDIKTN